VRGARRREGVVPSPGVPAAGSPRLLRPDEGFFREGMIY
jgi:hypothetical protein